MRIAIQLFAVHKKILGFVITRTYDINDSLIVYCFGKFILIIIVKSIYLLLLFPRYIVHASTEDLATSHPFAVKWAIQHIFKYVGYNLIITSCKEPNYMITYMIYYFTCIFITGGLIRIPEIFTNCK
jgi:hypothetical protein